MAEVKNGNSWALRLPVCRVCAPQFPLVPVPQAGLFALSSLLCPAGILVGSIHTLHIYVAPTYQVPGIRDPEVDHFVPD